MISIIDDPMIIIKMKNERIIVLKKKHTFIETVASCVICSKSGISQDLIVNGVVKSSTNDTSFVLIDIANVLAK
jgi:hypothetical protein